MSNTNSFKTRQTFNLQGKTFHYHSLKALEQATGAKLDTLPFSIKILIENLLRCEDGFAVKKKDIEALLKWNPKAKSEDEIQFTPGRVILQDLTGVPAVADLAAARNAIQRLGGDPNQINPLAPADLVIDHSVQVDHYGSAKAFEMNMSLEYERNNERYEFLRWGQKSFRNFRVVPPETGIVHQVNLEYLAQVAMTGEVAGETWVYPDTVVGTDSHTTMINGLGVLGWGVGGIEAEAALLGQPCSMLIPEVVGFRLKGKLKEGTTATDLVLTVTQMLRKKGVVGKFVEFFGPGLANLSLADRAVIANMAPEYGATCGLFPVDSVTTDFLKLTGRKEIAERVETYFKAQGLWYTPGATEPICADVLDLDMAAVEASMAGPARPQDRVTLPEVRKSFRKSLQSTLQTQKKMGSANPEAIQRWVDDGESRYTNLPEFSASAANPDLGPVAQSTLVKQPDGQNYYLNHGSVVITAITSCTNTSNPSVLMAAGLVAKKAVERGLITKPWVKPSLAPGSKVVTDYLVESGLMPYLEALKFHLVGYGCTTCIGNSGPLPEHLVQAINSGDLAVASVLSGNRNFEGRVNPNVRANYLASPPLVVAYAIAGNINLDLTRDPLGYDPSGNAVFLKDIWPTQEEVESVVRKYVTAAQFDKSYADVFKGDQFWNKIKVVEGNLYKWDSKSTYIKEPPFFGGMTMTPNPITDITGARVLALLGDSVTTDHISPAGNISKSSPAAKYLTDNGVTQKDFNSYGARRGNHEVMVRGTFANIRLKNLMVPGIEGGVTIHVPTGKQMSIYDASMEYQAAKTPLVIIAGKEYGTGSSRDWAAKGTKLLGARAVIVESFERIHRSNLVGMGVLPLQFLPGESATTHKLTGKETLEITGLTTLTTGQKLVIKGKREDGSALEFTVLCRIDTPNEIEYYKHGGILPYVLRQMVGKKK